MNNLQYSPFVKNEPKIKPKFYEKQKCPNCSKFGSEVYCMVITNDGGSHQQCSKCNWEWHAPNPN